jgi:hypothetical protein
MQADKEFMCCNYRNHQSVIITFTYDYPVIRVTNSNPVYKSLMHVTIYI